MAIQKIEEIYINGIKGQFAGGYIYSLKMSRGYSESPSKVTISVVLDDNKKNFSIPKISGKTSYSIKIGEIVMPSMFFIAYNTSYSVGQKILNCEFIDASFNLDKFFVGLLNRHAAGSRTLEVKYDVTANCLSCSQDDVVPVPGKVTQFKSALGVDNTGKILKGIQSGNLLILGEEEFVEGSCDVPDVKYSFSDLLSVMPFKCKGFPALSSPGTNYTGSLREVLSNWVSDFGGTFSFNPFTNELEYISLTSPASLDSIKNFIESNYNSNSTIPISSYEYSSSLEGTYSQRVGTYFLKSSRTTTNDFSFYSPISLKCEKVFGINPRSDDVLSAVLALYDTRLRTIYLSFMLNSSSEEDRAYGARKLGLKIISNLNTNGIFNLGVATLRDIYYKNPGGRFILAYSDQGAADSYLEFDRRLAENVGKNYTLQNFPIGTKGIVGNLVAYAGQNITFCQDPYTKTSVSYEVFPNISVSNQANLNGTFQRGTAVYDPAPGEVIFSGDIDNYLPSYMEIEGELFNKLIDTGTLTRNSNINGLKIIYIPPGLKSQVASIAVGKGLNRKEEGLVQEIPSETKDCLSACENYLTTLCKNGLKCEEFKSYPPTRGLTLDSQNIRVNILNISIVLPYQSDYLGYLKTTQSITKTKGGSKKITSDSNPPHPDALSLKYVSYDITSANDEAETVNIDSESPPPTFDAVSPSESVSIKIIGLNFKSFENYIYGTSPIMDNFNITLDENGLFSDITFKTRPLIIPKKEVIMQRVTPQKITIIK